MACGLLVAMNLMIGFGCSEIKFSNFNNNPESKPLNPITNSPDSAFCSLDLPLCLVCLLLINELNWIKSNFFDLNSSFNSINRQTNRQIAINLPLFTIPFCSILIHFRLVSVLARETSSNGNWIQNWEQNWNGMVSLNESLV